MIKRYRPYLIKLALEILVLPLYWLSFFSVRNNRIWVFGEWHGMRYADNAKYLFEYVSSERKEVKAVWITKDKAIASKVSQAGYLSYHAYSVPGLLACLRAKVVLVTHDSADVCHFMVGGSTLINLTHGVPLKHLGKDVGYKRFGSLTWVLERFVLPLLAIKKRFDYIICADQRSKGRFESAFSVKNGVYPVGYPRWDGFAEVDLSFLPSELSSFEKVVLYAPTLRFNNHVEYNPFGLPGFDEFLAVLRAKNFIMLYRPHPSASLPKELNVSENFKIVTADVVSDINPLFLVSDVLVTDYSSVAYDYEVLSKPVHYFVPDLDVYINDDVGMYGDFYQDALGPIAKNWLQLANDLSAFSAAPASPPSFVVGKYSKSVFEFVKGRVI